MQTSNVDEDSIDLETLQAQIDMSMSLAQEMVSSWVKPSRKLSSRSSRDVEAELKEYMRRPPRLGVGAAIPEAQNFSRETARLKGQLIGKGNKRSREDEPDSKEIDKSDDEEESRGGAITKKARVDPFADKGKKEKKNADQDSVSSVPLMPPTLQEAKEEVVSMVSEVSSSHSATPKRKKRKKKLTSQQPMGTPEAAIMSAPATVQKVNKVVSPKPDKGRSPPNTPPKVLKVIDVSESSTSPMTPLQMRRQAQSVVLLQHPLLNLAPVSDNESEDIDDAKSNTGDGPIKKRKRRRKKKKKGDPSINIAPDTVS